MNKEYWTVKEINTYIQGRFTNDPVLNNVTILGEVSEYRGRHTSGHCYFKIKDANSCLNVIIWSGTFKNSVRLGNGKLAYFKGYVTTYSSGSGSNYQLIVTDYKLEGEGEQYQKFLELKEKLEKEGLFDESHKKPILKYPTKVGIITSKGAAGLTDIQNVRLKRNPYIEVYQYAATVQGKNAPETIIAGIEFLDKMKLDCIIIARGGGADDDMICFNDEALARKVYAASTPIISAVGHARDFCLCDYVADLRCETPTAAATRVFFNYEDFEESLEEQTKNLRRIIENKLSNKKNIFLELEKSIMSRNPKALILERKNLLSQYKSDLKQLINDKLNDRKLSFTNLASRLDGLSPLKKISNGYAFLTDEKGNRIDKPLKLKPHSRFIARTKDAKIISEVCEVKKEDIWQQKKN